MLEVFNEIMFLFLCYPYLMFSDYAWEYLELQYQTGWVVIGILGLMTVVNIVYICVGMRKSLYQQKRLKELEELKKKM